MTENQEPKKPKFIINDPVNAVEEFIQGLCLQYPHRLVKLKSHNVLLLRQQQRSEDGSSSRVQLLCGGGSGHEPSHAGWIGTGMLRGAVCGGMFASPSVPSILAAIRAAAAAAVVLPTSPASSGDENQTATKNPVLLIVKNYTGDRLNFGLACERAKSEGLVCDLIVIADDVALPRTKGITGARGVAGTVLINKIAGAAAAEGTPLAELKELLQNTAACLGTLGIALNSVTVPGSPAINGRLEDDTIMEIGLGIHGEAGLRQSKLLTAQEMSDLMLRTIQEYGRVIKQGDKEEIVPLFQAGDELALLVNNLGGTSNFEMSILAKSCVLGAEGLGANVTRVYVGSYMTSFNMHGASLTILNLTAAPANVAHYLDAATDAPAWSACEVWKASPGNQLGIRPSLVEWDVTELSNETAATTSDLASLNLPPLAWDDFGSVSRRLVEVAARALIEHEPILTEYDRIVGDGDCGITMKRGATEVLKILGLPDASAWNHPVPLFAALADAVSESMGGTSGVLLELMFRTMRSTLAGTDGIDGSGTTVIGPSELSHAFERGVNAVSTSGGAKLGDRTMLDALIPAVLSLVQATDAPGSTIVWQSVAAEARQGADRTATMPRANAGRSNYASEETLIGTPDPGAVAVALVFEAIANS